MRPVSAQQARSTRSLPQAPPSLWQDRLGETEALRDEVKLTLAATALGSRAVKWARRPSQSTPCLTLWGLQAVGRGEVKAPRVDAKCLSTLSASGGTQVLARGGGGGLRRPPEGDQRPARQGGRGSLRSAEATLSTEHAGR